jgi:hypothetical protein
MLKAKPALPSALTEAEMTPFVARRMLAPVLERPRWRIAGLL